MFKPLDPTLTNSSGYVRELPQVVTKIVDDKITFYVDRKPFLVLMNYGNYYRMAFKYELEKGIRLIIKYPTVSKNKSTRDVSGSRPIITETFPRRLSIRLSNLHMITSMPKKQRFWLLSSSCLHQIFENYIGDRIMILQEVEALKQRVRDKLTTLSSEAIKAITDQFDKQYIFESTSFDNGDFSFEDVCFYLRTIPVSFPTKAKTSVKRSSTITMRSRWFIGWLPIKCN